MLRRIPVLSVLPLLVVLLLMYAAPLAYACSCMVNNTVDKVFEATPNIVVLKLRAVEKYRDGETGYGLGKIKQSRLTVERVYKGSLKAGQELIFQQGGGGDCVWTFSEGGVGHEFLFYLGAKQGTGGVWTGGTCTRSGSLNRVAADVLYLNNREKVKGRTRFSGTLTQAVETASGDGSSYDLLTRRNVVVTGNGQTYELKTDRDGVFEVYDLAPGKYKVTPERIEGYTIDWYAKKEFAEVEIKAGSHSERSFFYEAHNRIAGKFYDSSGNPLKKVCLRLRPAQGKEANGFFEMDCTKDDGSFEIDEIPTGSYLLVINEDGKITSDQPFRKFYYPAAKRPEEATVINITPGVFIDDMVITAPETAKTITIRGYVVHDDGKRASKSNLEYLNIEFFSDKGKKDPDRSADGWADIDENGAFSIRVLMGDSGELSASLNSFSGRFENCPKHEKLVKENKQGYLSEIRSPMIKIDGANDLSDVELKLPFPSCKRKEIE